MLVDFAVNNQGDILIEDRNLDYSTLHLAFNITDTSVQKISFNINDRILIKNDINRIAHNLKLSFYIDDSISNKGVSLLNDDDVKIQLLKLKLKDVLGELPALKEWGSSISEFKHKNINENNLIDLNNLLEKELNDNISNVKVKSEAFIDMNDAYIQKIKIYILNPFNNELLFTYIL